MSPNDFSTAMNESREAFVKYVRDPLATILGGKIVQTEGNGEVGHLLDIHAGIDALLIHPQFGVLGIAVRIQYDKNWRTFTVRMKRETQVRTEFAKLLAAQVNGGITPKLMVQAYVDRENGRLLGAAVAQTEDVYQCIASGPCETRQTSDDQIGRAAFHVVDWDTLKNNRIRPMWFEEFGGYGNHLDHESEIP